MEFDSDSDWESYSDTTDSEDQNGAESVFGDHAQNILSSLDASIRKIDDFLSVDRGFEYGDYVSSLNDASGLIGLVVDVNMCVDLEGSYGDIVNGVDSRKILRLHSFDVGDHVILGSWVGKVDRVFYLVTILFDDGSKCQINTGDSESLILSSSFLEDAPCPYCPGQRVQIKHSTLFNSARWLCGTYKGSREEGIICQTEITSVHVNWLASVIVGNNIISPAPPSLHNPKDLTLLSCYLHATWQLGDWCKLPPDYFQSLQMTVKENISPNVTADNVVKMHKVGIRHHARDPVYVIAKTRAKVDIMWQDGRCSVGVDSCTLFPVSNVGDHDFWPGQVILQKVTSAAACDANTQHLGIVREVDVEERTVKVHWIESELNHVDCSHGELIETLSAYELIEHPDFSYCLGDVVIRCFLHFGHLEEIIAATQDDSAKKVDKFSLVEMKMSLEDHDSYGSHYLSCIGNVIGYRDGIIEVKWASGLVSEVKASEVIGLERYDGTVLTRVHTNEAAGESSSKASEYDCQSCHGKGEDMHVDYANDTGGYFKKVIRNARALFSPQAAVGLLTNVAAALFGCHGSCSLSCANISGYSADVVQCCKPDFEEAISQVKESECQIVNGENVSLHDEIMSKPKLDKQIDHVSPMFKQFAAVDDYSDHHFVDEISKELGLSQIKRGWLKKIQQEWIILEKNLPDTVYVRIYEERMDLLRAAIVGAPGTPYHDALFFFDICFPPDYPHEPPLVHYNSGGLRLNPNLYESGKVCLSLLNTWTGNETEAWNPGKSTILQVLLSLQALVLNEKPYFNEAGYDKQIGRADGERNSITYNENAFLLSCKSILYLLRKPPKNFEQFVVDHFTHRSCHILLACKAYMNGTQVGCASLGEKVEEGYRGNSTGFKIMMLKLFPMLVSGFEELGVDCSQFLDCKVQTDVN